MTPSTNPNSGRDGERLQGLAPHGILEVRQSLVGLVLERRGLMNSRCADSVHQTVDLGPQVRHALGDLLQIFVQSLVVWHFGVGLGHGILLSPTDCTPASRER